MSSNQDRPEQVSPDAVNGTESCAAEPKQLVSKARMVIVLILVAHPSVPFLF